MSARVVYIHTVPSLVTPFNELSKELLPAEVDWFHIADEMLLKLVLAEGGLTPFIFRRVAEHVVAAYEAGATLIQVTCSSISPCVVASRPMVPVPVLKIDEPMVDQALLLGTRIGVAATVPTTLKPTSELVFERAKHWGKEVEVESVLCEGAFSALMAGDGETHDRIVRQRLRDLMDRTDVILLAQASMARVAATIPPEEQKAPILSSPRLAVEHLRKLLTS
ncbi:MAG: aspartate/glutamate racemase family protein [Anaerolineales bacterium]|jgi:Asp/Glu/hydantoin racemase|nr:aspartate/glutamate racemase family protein [Anaerolineales bacterium]